MKNIEEWSVSRWIFTTIGAGLAFVVLGFAVNSALRVGTVAVDREVMENSFQYNEARKTASATYQAELASLRAQLNNPNLTESDRANINGQIARINILTQAEGNR